MAPKLYNYQLIRPFCLASALAVIGACSWSKFDDLGNRAPATRIGGSGGAFGRPSVGFAQPSGETGGVLFIGGADRGAAVLNTVTFASTGAAARSAPTSSQLNDPDKLNLGSATLLSIAGLRFSGTIGNSSGPFAFVGVDVETAGRVDLIDLSTFERVGQGLEKATGVAEAFGSALVAARLSGGPEATTGGGIDQKRRDLVVGAKGRIFLFRHMTTPGSWVNTAGAEVVGDIPAADEVLALAVGNIQPTSDEDEIVVGAPTKDYVGVVNQVSGTPTVNKIRLPSAAERFGEAILVANIDGGVDLEVVVGAPETNGGAGAVYVYKLTADFFANPATYFDTNTAAKETEIAAPAGAASFGASLAYGKIDGTGKNFLAIGAPTSNNNAGQIFIYDASLANPGTLELGAGGDLLGQHLTTLPFKVGMVVHELLVASAKSSALVFFAGTTEAHVDVRE